MTPPADTFITVAFGDTTEQVVRDRWIDPIRGSWPDGPADSVVVTPLDLTMRLELAARGIEPDVMAPLLIVAPAATDRDLALLLDTLQVHLLPAILLTHSTDQSLQRLESEGVVVTRPDTPPAILAAMLFALSRRQRTVQRIAVDLRVSRRAQGGVSGEMQRLQEELASAADVQREFLPRTLPDVPDLDFGVIFRPVGYVSGDVYDLFLIDEQTVGFFIADVVGHGVPAALLTVALCRGLQALDRRDDGWTPRRPRDVLARLNEDLVSRQFSGQRFATGVYGIIDRKTGEVSLSCGGHPPPMIVSREGAAEIEASGPLLGVFADAEFDETTFTLEPGHSLLLYTDGVETAFSTVAGSAKPTKAYMGVFSRVGRQAASREITVAAVMPELAEELDRQSGSLHGVDDVTVLAISRAAVVASLRAA
ncbi:MAG: serine/threonine-protein phosphatase [Phycisphaerae bacterium]|nr:serine/threonine-protein phosphatase [Phycisphaerae bacterium]